MDISKKFASAIFLIIFIITSAYASFSTYANIPKDSLIVNDFSTQDKFLILNSDGTTHFLTKGILKDGITYNFLDDECSVSKLNNMTLAFPFLLNAEKTCILDENKKQIYLLNQVSPPPNSYSLMYFGENDDWIYFLINGRPWETSGYLKLRTINKKTQEIYLHDLILEVPGYSSGMWHSGKIFFITVWDDENEIFSLDISLIWETIHNSSTISFDKIAKKVLGPFSGFSIKMFATSDQFLFDNSTYKYQSYLINRLDNKFSPLSIQQDCHIISPVENEWLIRCLNGELKKGIF